MAERISACGRCCGDIYSPGGMQSRLAMILDDAAALEGDLDCLPVLVLLLELPRGHQGAGKINGERDAALDIDQHCP